MVKKTSKQNLSHYQGTTFNFGELIPVQCLEAVQGDTFRLQTQAFLRLAPMVFPVIQPIWVRIHHWYVPLRQLWGGYEEFATGKDLTRTLPFFYFKKEPYAGTFSLFERMGLCPSPDIPNLPDSGTNLPILPILAYWKIWKEFYADEQLDETRINAVDRILNIFSDKTREYILKGGNLDPAEIDKLYPNETTLAQTMKAASGTNWRGFFEPTKVAWHKDYFAGARPTPIIGEEITIDTNIGTSENPFALMVRGEGTSTFSRIYGGADSAGNYELEANNGVSSGAGRNLEFYMQGVGTDTGAPLSISLSELMAGFALQRIFQDQAMYGNRYQEWLAGQGVRYSDKTLQLPKYIGGGKDLFDINEVIQTSGTSANAGELGQFAGRGTASVSSKVCYHYCEEPGIILTLASIVPKNMYSIQGIRKNWARRTFEETYQPQLEHLDMQPIKNSEIYLQNTEADSNVFGYTPRYDELRTQESFVSGGLKKGKAYGEFTMSRNFSQLPVLNGSFIQCNPSKDIFYDQQEDSVIGVFKNKTIARRHLIKRSHIKLS